jgi:D-methionine transport system ATP-binding protein
LNLHRNGGAGLSNPIIEIKSLSKTYKSKNTEVHALKDINLSIEQGEIFGIIGMSGAGKSTLVRCINMLEKPTEGTVLFDGRDLSKLSERELRQARHSMGMIFQQFNLLMQRTAEGNVCFPLEIAGVKKAQAKEKAKELLELVGLSDRAKSYPSQLSGGQKQRVAIARALATNPKVLLCDEATSALDPTTTASILALLKDINHRLGITIVIITHQMSVIEEICNRVAIIDESKIAEVGAVQDIFNKPQTAAARKLVYPDGKHTDYFVSKRCMRIVFDGNSSFEPIIANMVLDCKAPVNIMYADTKNIDGKAFGQMVVQLPEDEALAQKMFAYVRARGLSAEEVNDYVG